MLQDTLRGSRTAWGNASVWPSSYAKEFKNVSIARLLAFRRSSKRATVQATFRRPHDPRITSLMKFAGFFSERLGTLVSVAPQNCFDNIGVRHHRAREPSSDWIDELIVDSFNDLRLLGASHMRNYSESAPTLFNRPRGSAALLKQVEPH